MQNQQDRNNKSILYAIIAILLLFNIGLFYLWQSGNSKRDELTNANSALGATIKQKESMIAAADAMIAQYKSDSITMSEANKSISRELAAKNNEIARLTFELRKSGSNSKAIMAELQSKLSDMAKRLAELERENVELKEKNENLNKENAELNTQNNVLSKEGNRFKSLAS